MQVAALGRATLDGLASAGVVGVMKHIPGHGRALVDSHLELPVVTASDEELATDLQPFERLRTAPMAMVAHVLYTAWDAERPVEPVAVRDRGDHPRAHRFRRLADERRHQHEGAVGHRGRARRRLRRRRMRCRAAVQRRARRQYRGCRGGRRPFPKRASTGSSERWPRSATCPMASTLPTLLEKSATRCWRSPSYPQSPVLEASHNHYSLIFCAS